MFFRPTGERFPGYTEPKPAFRGKRACNLRLPRKLGSGLRPQRIDSPIRSPPVVVPMKPATPRAPTKRPLAPAGRAAKLACQGAGAVLAPAPGSGPHIDWRQSAAHRMDKSKLPRWGRRQAAALLAASQGGP